MTEEHATELPEERPESIDLSAGASDPEEKKDEAPLGSPWEDLRAYITTPRLTGLRLAPDGSRLVASVQGPNAEKNGYVTALWQVDPAGEKPARRLTRGVEGEAASAFLRDGSLVFSGKRTIPAEGDEPVSDTTKALWCLPAEGGEAYVLAKRDGGWESVITAKDADTVVLAVPAHPGTADEKADAEKRAARKKAKVSAILHTGVPVRFWDHDLGVERTRLLAATVDTAEGDARIAADAVRALSGDVGASLSGPYALSDDGTKLATGWDLARRHGQHTEAIALWDVASGERTIVAEEGMHFYAPLFSPDGRTVAIVAALEATPDEAPEQWLALLDAETGERRDLTKQWDRWAGPVAWSPDGATLYAEADEDGESPIFAIDVASGEPRRLTQHGAFSSVQVAPDGVLYALRTAYDDPGSIVRIDPATGDVTELKSPVSYPELPGTLQRIETTASDGTRIPGYLVLPKDASAEHPAPLVLWVHGGPLGSWNAWSWRWCPWLLASQGYAVALPDPALSTGYGRDFIQRGWGRWGEATYTDILAFTDFVEARADIDASKTAMMGGSFGGYMANWIATHTDRFDAIVSHASLWNLETFGSTTDAPWYWDVEMSPEMRTANSPHLAADQITTPMLVIHGDKDYRVPIGEGLALWWALVQHFDGEPDDLPHRFLYFPDENHWVLTPNHAKVWYEAVLSFLGTHVLGRPEERPELV